MTQLKVTHPKRSMTYLWFLLPSLLGVAAFFVVPFVLSLYYAMLDNSVSQQFVGLTNFAGILSNNSFQLALRNTLIFLGLCLPLNIVQPLGLAMMVNRSRWRNVWMAIFMLPLVIPSGSMVFFWQNIFGLNGVLNGLFSPQNPVNWINSPWSRGIVIVIFLWKSAGYNVVLFLAGLRMVPRDYYESASVEGAGKWQQFRHITLVYLTPTVFLAFVMSFINSFKVYKEIYMLYGSYPNEHIYMLQHFIFNQFRAADYQKLTSAAYILTLLFVGIVLVLFVGQRKISEHF